MGDYLTRRRLLGGTATLIGGGAAAGLGVMSMSGSVAAHFSADDFGGLQDVSITSDAGQVNWVAVKAAMLAEWDGFEEDVHYFKFQDEVIVAPNNNPDSYVIHDTGIVPSGGMAGGRDETGWGGNNGWHSWSEDSNGGENHSDVGKAGYVHADINWGILQKNRQNIYNDGYGLPDNPAPTSRLENDNDGTTKDTGVKFIKRVRLYDADKNPLTGPNAPSWGPSDAKVSGTFVVSVTNEEASATGSGDNDGTFGDGNNEESL